MARQTVKHPILKEIKDWLQVICAAVVLAFLINRFIIINSDVPSGSMEPTIMTNSRIIGSRLTCRFSDIERGDVVIFLYGWRCPVCSEPVEGERQDSCPFCHSEVEKRAETVRFVKRVIGIPGDTIEINENGVFLNDGEQPLEETYLAEEMEPRGTGHFEVPENCYFMMGDNRNDSNDARFWKNPYIDKSKILAKVYIEYFPQIKIIR